MLLLAALLAAMFFSTSIATAQVDSACPPATGVALQVLGSGGPVADDARASSAYLVWLDGRARVLVDAGGGAFLRFGEADARFEDLDLVALSHFHTDHSADFPALLKSGYFSDRRRDLLVVGPDGRQPFPGLEGWLAALLGRDGAYAYLGGYLDGTDGLMRLERATVSPDGDETKRVFANDRLMVDALGVPHGIVPSIAFRVTAGGRSIVFGSDQNGENQAFVPFAADADLLVAHLAIPESATGAAVRLHARPSTVGSLAAQAGVGQVLLSHFMARSLRDLEQQVGEVRRRFGGTVRIATDLMCLRP